MSRVNARFMHAGTHTCSCTTRVDEHGDARQIEQMKRRTQYYLASRLELEGRFVALHEVMNIRDNYARAVVGEAGGDVLVRAGGVLGPSNDRARVAYNKY